MLVRWERDYIKTPYLQAISETRYQILLMSNPIKIITSSTNANWWEWVLIEYHLWGKYKPIKRLLYMEWINLHYEMWVTITLQVSINSLPKALKTIVYQSREIPWMIFIVKSFKTEQRESLWLLWINWTKLNKVRPLRYSRIQFSLNDS